MSKPITLTGMQAAKLEAMISLAGALSCMALEKIASDESTLEGKSAAQFVADLAELTDEIFKDSDGMAAALAFIPYRALYRAMPESI